MWLAYMFFFQAEDGIRDYKVTGVQTCALPISARVAWTPTGNNVPDYPKLAQLWWKNVAQAVTGEKTPQGAMDNLAEEMDQVMSRLQRAGMAHCAPKQIGRASCRERV